ncbi:proline-trna ligase associated domain-containing protein [Cystoisospora suis]|uniref:Proline-trna ligase associated domain-containing protein n=1 Tax=Cystoisospora suis TaxID=483139 RepID=A0A2C6LC11_9APIC|nr:proline-trna ligase associated domain-containing protein [Cystoisospora suis]
MPPQHPRVPDAASEDAGFKEPSTDPPAPSPAVPSGWPALASLPVEERVRKYLVENNVEDFDLVRVRPDYYELTLEERRNLLGAPSVDHLCKTVVMENTKHTGVNDKINSKYYMVVIQYSRKVNGERVKDLIKQLNAERGLKLGNKKLNFNFCKDSEQLTGFVYNAITPFASTTAIPVIVDSPILSLDPPFIWLGGGEVDLKLRVTLSDINRVFEPHVGPVCFESGCDKQENTP